MGYIASDIATVPAINGKGETFEWFVFLLPGRYKNRIRDEIIENFEMLSTEVGTRSLVVKGADLNEFHSEVILRYALYLQGYSNENIPLPSLLVTDTLPAKVEVKDGKVNAKIIIFPLAHTYMKDGMLSDFLRQLSATLQDSQAFDDIAEINKESVISKWGVDSTLL